MFRLAAADLVDQHRFGSPDGCRSLEALDLTTRLVRVRKTDEILEGDQTGVVVPMLGAGRFPDAVQQVGLAGATATDQQQRILGHQRREDRELHRLEALGAAHGEVVVAVTVRQELLLAAAAAVGRRVCTGTAVGGLRTGLRAR